MEKTGVLTAQAHDFPRWYQEVVAKAELADNGPVRGTMVIRPYGYAIWERMQAELDARIKAAGAANAYFPLFIPESYLARRRARRGLQPRAGRGDPRRRKAPRGAGRGPPDQRDDHQLLLRQVDPELSRSPDPDQPMVQRRALGTAPPALPADHANSCGRRATQRTPPSAEAAGFALRILHEVYEDFMVNVLAIPVLTGRKTERERFAGAITTWTCEAMMRDGKALQMGTSHELGQKFARVFDITYLDNPGDREYVWQTSWGASTRLMGALVMAHGDDDGLRLPPAMAPVQVVVVLVRDKTAAGEAAGALAAQLRDSGCARRARRADRHLLRAPGRRLGAERRAAAESRWDPAISELRSVVLVSSRHGHQDARARWPWHQHGVEHDLAAVQAALLEEATQLTVGHTVEAEGLDEARRLAAREGFAGSGRLRR